MRKIFLSFTLFLLTLGSTVTAQNNVNKEHNFDVAKNLETVPQI